MELLAQGVPLRLATYLALYRPGNGLVSQPSPLRTGRDHRRAHTRQVRAGRRFAQPMLSVHDRSSEPTDRSTPGHREGDLIVGPNHRSGIGTLVERQTRYTKLLHLPVQDSITVHAAPSPNAGPAAGHPAPHPHLGSGHRDGPPSRGGRRRWHQGVLL